MFWLVIVLIGIVYCWRLVPTWCYVFLGLRAGHKLAFSWAIASVAAMCWFIFLPQHKRWLRAQSATPNADEAEREFHSLYPTT